MRLKGAWLLYRLAIFICPNISNHIVMAIGSAKCPRSEQGGINYLKLNEMRFYELFEQ